jgi:hypothetical protein
MKYVFVPGARGLCVMATGEDYSVRELLIEMKGDLNLIKADNQRTNEDMSILRQRQHEFANRLQTFEAAAIADRNLALGEQRGVAKTIKAVYALATICGLGGIAAAAKILLPIAG